MVDQYSNRWYPDYPGQLPQNDPQYIAWLQAQQTRQPQPIPQSAPQMAPQMTPYIDARMMEVHNIAEAEAFRLDPGQSQFFYTSDRSTFIIKEQGQTGYNLMIYDRRPPEPQAAPLDPTQYVTREEFEKRLAAYPAPSTARSGLNSGSGE